VFMLSTTFVVYMYLLTSSLYPYRKGVRRRRRVISRFRGYYVSAWRLLIKLMMGLVNMARVNECRLYKYAYI